MIDYAIEAIKNGYVTKYSVAEKLEKIYYNGDTNKVEQYLSKISAVSDKQSTNLLAMAMQVTSQMKINLEITLIEQPKPIQHIYDETSFEIILQSFLLGYCERTLDDIVICDHVDDCYSSLEEKEHTLSQISQLSKFACLLGKNYWNSTTITSEAFGKYIRWFLTTKLWRGHDYTRARKFLLFTLLQSHASEGLAYNETFIDNLKTCLFEIENIGMYYKTYILDYLKHHNKLDIIQEYILALYGDNCSKISLEENKAEIHTVFCPYGELVEPKMMERFTNQIKWDVIGYIGDKEYAMQGSMECFKVMISNDPSLWREVGTRLYQQSKIAEISNNHFAYDIRNIIMKAAVCSGLDDFWELHSWNNEFRINPDLIYNSLFEFIQIAVNSTDLEVIWLLSCGIHSWYTQEERMGAISIYNACLKKAQGFEWNFGDMVLRLTPQWITIINQEYKEKDYPVEENSHTKQKNDEIDGIFTEFELIQIEDLLAHLPRVPFLKYPKERYKLILDRLATQERLTIENAKLVLSSLCTYLGGKEWSYEQFDEIITRLLQILGEEAFWSFAHIIENHLSEYDYQTSTRNIQLLLKLYHGCDVEQIKILFEQELTTQEMWITGNDHIPVDYKFDNPNERFTSPKTLEEMAIYILLEQVESQNARKIEAAIFSIHCFGKKFGSVIDIIASEWGKFSEVQKDCLLLNITRWVWDGINLGKLYDVLVKEYITCNLLSRKYLLHSICLLIDENGVCGNSIYYSADATDVGLPVSGDFDKFSIYESFLSLIEEHDCSSQVANGIRRYISFFSAKEVYVDDEYIETGDIRIPVLNPEVNKILYAEEKSGRWNKIDLLSKKSRLVTPEDPFILTEMPRIVYDKEWFTCISDSAYRKHPSQGLNEVELSEIAHKNLSEDDIMLATSIWYPWGHDDGAIFIKTAKICSILNSQRNNQFDWCLGNFGLLANEGSIYETKDTSIYHGGINLFNRVGGKIRICAGNCQLAPTSAWRELLHCNPSNVSPYIWVSEYGNEVLRFERIASPTREAKQELYVRQPIIYRWICNLNWLQTKLKELELRLWYISDIEEMPK